MMVDDAAALPSAMGMRRFTPPLPGTRARSTDGRIIYAIGDVHGCYALLKRLLEAIVADIATLGADAWPLVVFCGDYVDRGPDSARVLSTLVWLSRHSTVEVVFLKGNHEALLLDFLRRPEAAIDWLREDGPETLRSYGIDLPAVFEPAVDESRRLRDRLADAMPLSHFRFLHDLPIRHGVGEYVFVHAGLRPGIALERQAEEDCLWIREEFLAAEHRFDRIVVHGHTWSSDQPHVGTYRIGIDTGAYSTGVLTAVRLEDARVECLQVYRGEDLQAYRGEDDACRAAIRTPLHAMAGER